MSPRRPKMAAPGRPEAARFPVGAGWIPGAAACRAGIVMFAVCGLATGCFPGGTPGASKLPQATARLVDGSADSLQVDPQGGAVRGAEPAAPAGAAAGAGAGVKTVPGQVVLTTDGLAPPDLADLGGATIAGSIELGARKTWLIQLPPGGDRDRAIEVLAARSGVRAVAPNHVIVPFATPPTNDPLLPSQWPFGSDVSDVYGAWTEWDTLSSARRNDSVVAVIDWFTEGTHQDLNLLTGYWGAATLTKGQPISTSYYRSADTDHGMSCAGVIGATKANGLGAAGVAPGVPVLPIRVSDSNGNADDFSIMQSMQIAGYYNRTDSPYTNTTNASYGPVRVVNMSLGVSIVAHLATYDASFQFLRDRGILVLVAAGNNDVSDGRVQSPANNPLATAVSCTMQYLGFEALAPYSSRGDEIWVAGPGNMIWATAKGNGYKLFNGTSSATPFVAGVAALINAKYGSGGSDQATATWTDRVRNRLAATATDLGPPGFDSGYGNGRVHALRAITGTMP